jgi:hypothetical protein
MVMGFFLSLLILGNIMLLSLFTAILLQNFEESDEDKVEAASKPKSDFSVKMIFTKSYMNTIKEAVISIFDPKGKKKAKKDPELQ